MPHEGQQGKMRVGLGDSGELVWVSTGGRGQGGFAGAAGQLCETQELESREGEAQ